MAIAHDTLAVSEPGLYHCEMVAAEGENAIRIKRLGICEGRQIELTSCGDPMVLRLGTARVGLSRELAKYVTVRPITELP